MAFTNLSRWLWSRKQPEDPKIPNGPPLNPSSDAGLLESDTLKFPLFRRGNMDGPSSDAGLLESDTLKFPLFRRGNMDCSSRRVKKKWHSREESKIDKEHDVVLVPSDGVCFSGSESDDSDWSIGWVEPYGPAFQSDDDDSDDSFAVLVPCYGRGKAKLDGKSKSNVLDNIGHIPGLYGRESKKHVEQWLSSLRIA